MGREEREPQLTGAQLRALKGLAGPPPLEDGQLIRDDPLEVVSYTRHAEIPATSVIPTFPPTEEEFQNVVDTLRWLDVPEGEASFNPVREYQAYVELVGLGLVEMTPLQGTNRIVVDLTPAGAEFLGRKLVKRE